MVAEEKKGTAISASVSNALLSEAAEKDLAKVIADAIPQAQAAIAEEDFEKAMTALATLRAPVDTFFDDVLVNDEDDAVRANRLALLAQIRSATQTVADFGKISG